MFVWGFVGVYERNELYTRVRNQCRRIRVSNRSSIERES